MPNITRIDAVFQVIERTPMFVLCFYKRPIILSKISGLLTINAIGMNVKIQNLWKSGPQQTVVANSLFLISAKTASKVEYSIIVCRAVTGSRKIRKYRIQLGIRGSEFTLPSDPDIIIVLCNHNQFLHVQNYLKMALFVKINAIELLVTYFFGNHLSMVV